MQSGRPRLERAAVSALMVADSPRPSGENDYHCRLLAEPTSPLSVTVVLRSTMGVIDGTHRLRAAVLRGSSGVVRYPREQVNL
ncbi:MAG: hypothetical protein JOZ47_10445 [Kutzneria sp.]|nr:hypothetical protein [Kutzneria sp.]